MNQTKKNYIKDMSLSTLLITSIGIFVWYFSGCAVTMNTVKDSEKTEIKNEQRVSQKNDSTQVNSNLNL